MSAASPHRALVRYSDGAERTMTVDPMQTLLEAAELNGVPIVSECQSGICGTCVARCAEGSYDLGQSIGLGRAEKAAGRILTCQTQLRSDCTIELDYPLDRNAACILSGDAVVTQLELLSPGSALLTLDISSLASTLEFKAGQFAQLQIPGTNCWRSYSYTHAPRPDASVEFLIRLLPSGIMSDYLRGACRVGDRLAIRCSKGEFYARALTRPVVLVAGGTGLSAVLAVAEQLVRNGGAQPIRLNYGVTRSEDLVLLPRLRQLESLCPSFSWRAVVRDASPDWNGCVGDVTDLLDAATLAHGEADVYLCGPPAMVDAVRDWIKTRGLTAAAVYYERFVASGKRAASAAAHTVSTPRDLEQIRRRGQGTAVVIGGSIAGIAAAKVLTEFFGKVIVIEKDPDHRRMEGRPGAAQGWHLHHLLLAGQRILESIFPGIIEDMVRAGAFKVDMGEDYRLMLAGSWKKVGHSGIEIVCAGRPLLEWCIRRRLDGEAAIEYRYDSEVTDLVLAQSSKAVIGVECERDGIRECVAAEFVVDASGKNTAVPAALERLGFERPLVEEDQINCFYSTMQHRVDPSRTWRDRVMVICYAHRPYQEYYAAQYFVDSSRTVLSTSLVGYNCYGPPRNAQEFREFARRMPSQAIGDELDGLEPCSPVYNFRYPTMQRNRYENCASLPGGLVAVGDAYCSADPVSGAGMSKAMLELDALRGLLRKRTVADRRFVQDYYRRVCRIADRIWFVIREQNLRYPWIADVASKRPFYFRAHNWYVDRVIERMHDDPDIYRLYLAVSHFIAPPRALLAPRVLAKVLGKWLASRWRGEDTLIERNFGRGRAVATGEVPCE